MHKLIVPTHGRLSLLKRCFEVVYQDDAYQADFIGELVKMASDAPLNFVKNKQHIRLGLSLSCTELVNDCADKAMFIEEDLTYIAKLAADFTSTLAYFMSYTGIVSENQVAVLEGFTNMDVVIKVLQGEEVMEEMERLWLKE